MRDHRMSKKKMGRTKGEKPIVREHHNNKEMVLQEEIP
jgi:hypothetical protein